MELETGKKRWEKRWERDLEGDLAACVGCQKHGWVAREQARKELERAGEGPVDAGLLSRAAREKGTMHQAVATPVGWRSGASLRLLLAAREPEVRVM